MFTAPSMTTVRSARRRMTLVCSTIAHAGALFLIVALPLLSGLSLPDLASRIDFVRVFAAKLPEVPRPSGPAPATMRPPVTTSGAPPTNAPPAIGPERDLPARASRDGSWLPNGGASEITLGADGPPLLAPPPKHDGPFPVGGRIQRPTRVFYVEPVYPEIAQVARKEGTVILEATIDERGNVVDVKVLRSVPLLDRAATDAVSRWRYSPTTLNGVAIAVVMTVTVTFTMR
jgi:protein TonB